MKKMITVIATAWMALVPIVAGWAHGSALACGDWSLLVKGGVEPAILTSEGYFWLTSTQVIPVATLPEFQQQFKTPWTVGAELGWNSSRRTQLFLEYAYTQAKGKLTYIPEVGALFAFQATAYKTHGGYVGARFYCDRLRSMLCRGASLYVGFKVGLVWQEAIRLNLDSPVLTFINVPYYAGQAAVSSGGQVGVEWWLCPCWSFALQGEIVATQGLRGKVAVGVSGTNIATSSSGWVLTFPLTLGLRRTF